MLSLSDFHQAWLSSYHDSPLFACPNCGKDCAIYHVLAPVLHDVGMWRSFESYRSILCEELARILLEQDSVDLLVAGIDSEASARTLMTVAQMFVPRIRVTFVDICQTPLNRLRAALQESEAYARAIQGDITNLSHPGSLGNFDLVVADAFLQQFPRAQRSSVLHTLKMWLRSDRSRLVVREYFGCMEDLLMLDWSRSHAPMRTDPTARRLWSDVRDLVTAMLPDLDLYLLKSGSFYQAGHQLVDDAAAGGMNVVHEHVSPSHADRVYVLEEPETGMPKRETR